MKFTKKRSNKNKKINSRNTLKNKNKYNKKTRL